jgi:hypothetical protein
MRARRVQFAGAAGAIALAALMAGGCGPSAEESAARAETAAAQAKAASERAQAKAALAKEQAADAQRRADHAVELFEAAIAEFNDAAQRLDRYRREQEERDESQRRDADK